MLINIIKKENVQTVNGIEGGKPNNAMLNI